MAQLTDTHIVREGSYYFGIDTARYLTDALDAVHELVPAPDYLVVTGDLANFGTDLEYARFREIMSRSHRPYFVIPGNHDDREHMRAGLPPATYGGSQHGPVRYAVDDFAIRLIGIDCNSRRPWPGAVAEKSTLAWLDETLSERPAQPTIVAVHQPPFRTGLHYLDAGGFVGRTRLRAIVERHAHVRAVVSGHIHCVRFACWRGVTASSAPSTSPQIVPLILTRGRIVDVAREPPGFAVHDLRDDGTFGRTEFRRDGNGRYRSDAT